MRIVVAVEFTPRGEQLITDVVSRPWPEGASFDVIHVLDSPHLYTPDEEAVEASLRAQRGAEEARARLQAVGLNGTAVILSGDPRGAIVDHARQTAADLIVIGAQSQASETQRLGGVAKGVVRHAPCSVEIVRTPSVRDSPGYRILLATDGSEYSRRAAESIAGRPWPSGTEVRILSAVELHLTAFQAAFEPLFVSEESMETARADAMQRTEEAIAEAERILAPAGMPLSEAPSVLMLKPARIIVDEASDWQADLIVVGSHGRRGAQWFVLGSVSETVADEAPCSVEVVRQMR